MCKASQCFIKTTYFIVFFKHSSNFNMISEILNIVYKWFNTLNIAQYISSRIYQLNDH